MHGLLTEEILLLRSLTMAEIELRTAPSAASLTTYGSLAGIAA